MKLQIFHDPPHEVFLLHRPRPPRSTLRVVGPFSEILESPNASQLEHLSFKIFLGHNPTNRKILPGQVELRPGFSGYQIATQRMFGLLWKVIGT